MYGSDSYSLSLYQIWHYLIQPRGSFCPSSVFSFLSLLFCLSVQNRQLCPHSLQVFLFSLSWAMILTLSSVSSHRWLERAASRQTLYTADRVDHPGKTLFIYRFTHIDIQRWFSLTCVSNIEPLFWPIFLSVFEQFNPKDNRNKDWLIPIQSLKLHSLLRSSADFLSHTGMHMWNIFKSFAFIEMSNSFWFWFS